MAESRDQSEGELPTLSMPAVDDPQEPAAMHVRLFGSTAFFRLWLTQVVSATGDWLGFLAIAALATRISDRPEAAIGLAILVVLFRNRRSINVQELNTMKG